MKDDLSICALKEKLPGMEYIIDSSIQEKIYQAWKQAFDESDWDCLEDVWIDPGNERGERLLPHVNRVTAMCKAVSDTLIQEGETIDQQLLLTLSLMHDVSKVVEFEPTEDGKCRFSIAGIEMQHGVIGAIIADHVGFDKKMIHLIHSHTKNSGIKPNYPEGRLFQHLDLADFEMVSFHKQEGAM